MTDSTPTPSLRGESQIRAKQSTPTPSLRESALVADSWQFKNHKNRLPRQAFGLSRNDKKDEFVRPFALYLLTNNTHSPDSFIEPHCEKSDDESYEYAVKCADSLISDFVAWVKVQDFYENTTILIVGDHLMNANRATPRANRRIYNAFINPRFCSTPSLQDSQRKSKQSTSTPSLRGSVSEANTTKQSTNQKVDCHDSTRCVKSHNDDLTKSRHLSHFDFAPLILDSLGICTKSFGLGRNPFLGQTLLESSLESNGADFEAQISADSRVQESFWQRD